jgi:Tfp pilus assembly protein FimT
LIESLVAIAVLGVMVAIAAPNVMGMGTKPLTDSVNRMSGQFRMVRSKAISQTSAYRFSFEPTDLSNVNSSMRMIVERANSCNSTVWTVDPTFTEEDRTTAQNVRLTFAWINNVAIAAYGLDRPTWDQQTRVCINSRGVADRNLRLQFQEGTAGEIITLELFPGGALQSTSSLGHGI